MLTLIITVYSIIIIIIIRIITVKQTIYITRTTRIIIRIFSQTSTITNGLSRRRLNNNNNNRMVGVIHQILATALTTGKTINKLTILVILTQIQLVELLRLIQIIFKIMSTRLCPHRRRRRL